MSIGLFCNSLEESVTNYLQYQKSKDMKLGIRRSFIQLRGPVVEPEPKVNNTTYEKKGAYANFPDLNRPDVFADRHVSAYANFPDLNRPDVFADRHISAEVVPCEDLFDDGHHLRLRKPESSFEYTTGGMEHLYYLLAKIRNEEATVEESHWKLVRYLFNNNTWESIEQKIVTAIAKETQDPHVKIYLALLRSIKSIIPEEQRKTYVFDFSAPKSFSPIEKAMQKKLVELLDTYRWLIQMFNNKIIDTEDIGDIIGAYEVYIRSNIELALNGELKIKDAIVYKIEEIIWKKFHHGASWKEIKKFFAFMYESYRKGDAFSLKARLRLSFLEARVRVIEEADISLFWERTEHRKILEKMLDKQDLLSQGEQKDMLEMITNFVMNVPRKSWTQVLDIIQDRINLDWITSQDRDRYTKMWEEEKKKHLSSFSSDTDFVQSIFNQFKSWNAWECVLEDTDGKDDFPCGKIYLLLESDMSLEDSSKSSFEYTTGGMEHLYYLLANIRDEEDTEKKHWALVNHLFNNNTWESIEQKNCYCYCERNT